MFLKLECKVINNSENLLDKVFETAGYSSFFFQYRHPTFVDDERSIC